MNGETIEEFLAKLQKKYPEKILKKEIVIENNREIVKFYFMTLVGEYHRKKL